MERKNIFIGAAWPYANGSLHLGHVSALIGADILARYFRLRGNSVLFVSGSDCHGTPIALEAEQQKKKPSEIAEKYHQEFKDSLIKGLSFSFDNYSSTMTENHKDLVQKIFLDLYQKKLIYLKSEDLPFCENCARFLPDRYIEGECPHCHYDSARGDQCDHCGRLTDVRNLIKPRCKTCQREPIFKESEHFFLKLKNWEEDLKKWIDASKNWRLNAKNFSREFIKRGLLDRAISRDTDWGIEIPLAGYEKKRIYVWFEAVCGYLSASQEWSKKNNNDAWKNYWQNPKALHYYIHGKDNIPFHTIIWPSILLGLENLHLPDIILSSEYLTLEKKQFSKSRRWAIYLPDFLKDFHPDTLRYYLVINGSESSDADFSWREFAIKTNNELISTLGNYINRVLSFVDKNFPTGISWPEQLESLDQELLSLAEKSFSSIGESIHLGRFREALRQVLALVDKANQHLNYYAPWKLIKEDQEKAGRHLAVAGQIIKALAILINPFLPSSSENICQQINFDYSNLKWEFPLKDDFLVSSVKTLYEKITEEEVERQLNKISQGKN